MTETTDVWYTESGNRIHTNKDCPRLAESDGEVKQTVVYHSRRLGRPNSISDKEGCPDCGQ